jgi:hypothetical protein
MMLLEHNYVLILCYNTVVELSFGLLACRAVHHIRFTGISTTYEAEAKAHKLLSYVLETMFN